MTTSTYLTQRGNGVRNNVNCGKMSKSKDDQNGNTLVKGDIKSLNNYHKDDSRNKQKSGTRNFTLKNFANVLFAKTKLQITS